jgi:Zn-dependent protease with chaperone function
MTTDDTRNKMSWRSAMFGSLLMIFATIQAIALPQTEVEPGFNLFSTESEIEIGRESAKEVERQLPVLRDEAVEDYVNRVGTRLAGQAPGADYPYQFKVLNLAEVNAFALPGGFMYLNRGLLESVRNEGELAGVLAHEIGHVALRHGTNQASKAYLTQAGLSVLGGLFGANSTASDVIGAVGGIGMPLLFLKFSRSAEEQADTLATQIMARAGYDPSGLVSFFDRLDEHSVGGAPPEFLSSHPSYENRRENIRKEAALVRPVNQTAAVGGLRDVQSRLDRLDPAPSMESISKSTADSPPPARTERGRAADVSIESPSPRFQHFSQQSGYYRISYPDNWRAHEARDTFGVTLAPEGGIVRTSTGQPEIVSGVLINHYQSFEHLDPPRSLGSLGFRSSSELEAVPDFLEEATRDILVGIMDGNPHLQPVSDSGERRVVDGEPALSVDLAGWSPVTGQQEHVTLVTRGAGDGHVLYVLSIATGENRQALAGTFHRMLESLRVDDTAVHSDR